jgi:hypothetical protein
VCRPNVHDCDMAGDVHPEGEQDDNGAGHRRSRVGFTAVVRRSA